MPLFRWRSSSWQPKRQERALAACRHFETLEDRLALSAASLTDDVSDLSTATTDVYDSAGEVAAPASSPSVVGMTPAQIRQAYGFDDVAYDGTGQTIAIVVAYDNPKLVNSTDTNYATSDLALFNDQFGLPDPPSFTKLNQLGQSGPLPSVDPAGPGNASWAAEAAMDVQWAHAIAPGASIVLIECNSPNLADLLVGVDTAASIPGVSVVAMSWGAAEFSTEASFDFIFSPTLRPNVSFVAATGDTGSPGTWPAYSPNVLAVGGTYLVLNPDDSYLGENSWPGSGGGTSQYITQPLYQIGFQSTGKRTIPDVALNASPTSGVAVYDSYNDIGGGPWNKLGGTSFGCPVWAGLIALANQARVAAGGSNLTGATQTLLAIYALPASDFHDITTGSNGGFTAGPGYDQVTGRGTPKAELVVADLAGYQMASRLAISAQPPAISVAGNSFGLTVRVNDSVGTLMTSYNGNVTVSLANNPTGATLGGTVTVAAVNGIATFTGLSITKAGSGYTIQASASGLSSITTSAFSITPAALSKLGVTSLPASVAAGAAFAVAVAGQDVYGNTISSFNGLVSLALDNNPGGGILAGTLTATATSGVANFPGLSINEPASGYTLRATSAGLTDAVSVGFTVANVPPVAAIAGPTTVARGATQTYLLTATDNSPSDQAGQFTFVINWGDGSPIDTVTGPSGTPVTHVFDIAGANNVSVTATDGHGGTSATAVAPVNVQGFQLAANQQNPTLTDLIWNGTSHNDQVKFEQLAPNTVRVTEILVNGVVTDRATVYNVVTGRVIANGYDSNDALDAAGLTTIKATLNGGAGNNTIYGGQAGDVLIGGSNGGEGFQGNNVVVGGAGDDTIYGNDLVAMKGASGGNNVITGGGGNDTIYGNYGTNPTGDGGEGGQNVIIGGTGADTIYASQQVDGAEGGQGSILVGGSTTLDAVALQYVLSEWISSDTYADRIAKINGSLPGGANGSNYLIAGGTVFNDGAIDQLFGDTNGSKHWYLPTLAQDVASRTKAGETITNVP